MAAEAARVAVMPLKRDGGQPQYIVHEQPGADGLSLEPLLEWMEENAHRIIDLRRHSDSGVDQLPHLEPARPR